MQTICPRETLKFTTSHSTPLKKTILTPLKTPLPHPNALSISLKNNFQNLHSPRSKNHPHSSTHPLLHSFVCQKKVVYLHLILRTYAPLNVKMVVI